MSIFISKKVKERIVSASKKYKRIIENAVKADINESDTVLIVRDMIEEIFGFDRYNEVTSEYCIRNTYCDVAIKINNKLLYLIEVKAIGIELQEVHLKQAIQYSTNAGIDWVILTNGQIWNAYKIRYKKPLSIEQILKIDWMNENQKDNAFIEKIFCLCKEGVSKTALSQYEEEKKATNRHLLGAIILSDEVMKVIRREIKKYTAINVNNDDLCSVVKEEVLKREIIEGEEATTAIRKYVSFLKKVAKKKENNSTSE